MTADVANILARRIKTRRGIAQYVYQALGYRRGVEVGSWDGTYARMLLSVCALDQLVMVDPYNGDGVPKWGEESGDEIFRRVRHDMAEAFGARALVWRQTSMQAVRRFKAGSLDFVYLDGMHTLPWIADDIREWWPKVRIGGVLSGHDYRRDVKTAVVAAFAPEDVRFNYRRCMSWWVYKAHEGQYREEGTT